MSERIADLIKRAHRETAESSITFSEKSFAGEAQSAHFFAAFKVKLLNISEWNKHASMSVYALFNEGGQALKSPEIAAGVFIRILLKGSGKYDWVRVIDIFEAADEFIVKVCPTYDPTAETVDKTVISHFFTDASTNNFCLLKRGATVAFYVIGLDEKMNTSETGNVLETIRNAAVKLSSYLGIQKTEWQTFCRSFIENF